MKIFRTTVAALGLLLLMKTGHSQDTNLASGDVSILKDEKKMNVEFVFNKVSVGDYAREADYIKKKKDEMNEKEAKSGDAWEVKWNDAKHDIYRPKFLEMFSKYSEMEFDSTAKYTLIFNVTFIEPGYQIAIKKKASQVEETITIVETANRSKKIATMTVERGGGYFRGGSYDTSQRIAEAFAVTGKKAGTIIKKGK